MAQSYSPLHFDGPLRSDANHAGNPQYAPNSFGSLNKTRPDTAEAPYAVADNVVSRKSHYYHEGKLSDYDQPRVLYERVMDDKARDHLHSNTAILLSNVTEPIIQSQYLAQLYCISPTYAKSVYELLREKKFDFSEVEEKSKTAPEAGKVRKFQPNSEKDRLVGLQMTGVYGM